MITHRSALELEEKRQKLAIDMLQLLNEADDARQVIPRMLDMIRQFGRFDAVSLRLGDIYGSEAAEKPDPGTDRHTHRKQLSVRRSYLSCSRRIWTVAHIRPFLSLQKPGKQHGQRLRPGDCTGNNTGFWRSDLGRFETGRGGMFLFHYPQRTVKLRG